MSGASPAEAAYTTGVLRTRRSSLARNTALLGAGLFALVGYCLALWFDWLPDLRGWHNYPEGWTWPTYPLPPLERFVPVLCFAAAIWCAVRLAERLAGRARVKALFLALLVLLGFGFQLSLMGFKSANPVGLLVERVAHRHVTSYFAFASRVTNPDFLFRNYLAASRTCLHCQGHPPGPSVFYWLDLRLVSMLPERWQHNLATFTWQMAGTSTRIASVRTGLNDSQTTAAILGGCLMLILASAVVVPLFGIARLLGPPGMEFRLAALGLALPGLMLMSPLFDQVYATITASALFLALKSLQARGPSAGLLASACGAVLALGIFFTWALGAIALVVAALAFAFYLGSGRLSLLAYSDERPRLLQLLPWIAGLAAGFIVPVAALEALAQPDLLRIFEHNMHHVSMAERQRPYEVWLWRGPLDFVQFLGLPLAAATLAASVVPVRSIIPTRVGAVAVRWYSRVNIYTLLFWLTVIGIALAGRSRAEQGRLLIFLMPLALTAIYLWAGRARPDGKLIALLFVAQTAVCIVIGARWLVP
jgi:hypothetical protein